MDAEGLRRSRTQALPCKKVKLSSRPGSPLPISEISKGQPVPSSVSEGSVADDRTREQDKKNARAHRSPAAVSEAQIPEGKQILLHRPAQTASENFLVAQGRRAREDASFGPSSALARRRRSRQQARRSAAGRRGILSSTPLVFRFGAFLLLLTFYTHKCLDRGFSRFMSRLSASPYRVGNNEKPSYPDGHGPRRRLAGERVPHAPSPPRDSAEENLCSAIERAVQTSRAVASRTVQEESDDGTEPGPSAPPAAGELGFVEDPGEISYLLFSNDVAAGISRDDYTQSRVATADETRLWLEVLEAEERKRLESLRVGMSAFDAGVPPTWSQVNALLVSATQGQITLMRMSRVLSDHGVSKRLSLSRVAKHTPTVALARELRRGWGALGLTRPTLQALLRQAVVTVGEQTRASRVKLFWDLMPGGASRIDPKAHKALAAEESVFAEALQGWDFLKRLKGWITAGKVTLGAEDKRGPLGQILASDGPEGSPPRNAKPLPDTARAATGDADPSAEQIRSADRRPEAALREPDPAAKESYGASYLFFTNEVAVGVSRFDYTLSRVATAGERMSWLRILEAEERDRLESLRASMDALKTESTPTSVRVNALLVSALQAQITLMKMSRVFPDHAVSRRVDPTRALRHGATVALASELRRCWDFLGVTERTLKGLLWLSLNAISRQTLPDRQELFPDIGRKPRHKEPQPKPEEALVAEGLVFAAAIQQWDLLERLRVWAAIGYLKLSAEDEGGLLGQFTTDDSFLRDGACPRLADGCSYLVLSNEVAADIHPSDYTLSRVATAGERMSWLRILEAEEHDRLKSLRASMDALETEAMPTRDQTNALLVSALQGQITLMKISRVYPDTASERRVNLVRALRHGATVRLASELRRSWRRLGVADTTLKLILRHAVTAVGSYMHSGRARSSTDRIPDVREGTDPEARPILAAEGPAFAAAVQAWNPLLTLREMVALGDLTLTSEENQGILGRALAEDSPSIQSLEPEEPPLSPLSFDELFHILMDEEEWSLSPETDEETHADRSPATTPAGSTPSPELSSFREAAPEKTSVLRPASSLEAPSIQSPEREEPPLSPLSFDELLELLTDEERWWSSPEADEQAHIDERAGAPPAPLAPAQEISAVWDPAPHDLFIPHPASPSKGSAGASVKAGLVVCS